MIISNLFNLNIKMNEREKNRILSVLEKNKLRSNSNAARDFIV